MGQMAQGPETGLCGPLARFHAKGAARGPRRPLRCPPACQAARGGRAFIRRKAPMAFCASFAEARADALP